MNLPQVARKRWTPSAEDAAYAEDKATDGPYVGLAKKIADQGGVQRDDSSEKLRRLPPPIEPSGIFRLKEYKKRRHTHTLRQQHATTASRGSDPCR